MIAATLDDNIRALAFGLFALHDLLVAKGVLEPLEAAANLRRLSVPSDALQSLVAAVAEQFEAMPFAPSTGPQLEVIEGGKKP